MARRKKAVRANGRATRERIIESAEDFFSAMGYEASSLRGIAAGASIDIATLKYHFNDKPTLFGEVYQRGHQRFMEVLDPILEQLDGVDSAEDMEALLDDFVTTMHDFIEDDFSFVRLTLYRALEDSEDVVSVEEELQAIALSRLESKFQSLVERGIIRDVDTRALVVFLISSFSAWHVTGRFKPEWLGKPGLESSAGRARSEDFFIDLLWEWLRVRE